MEHFHHAKYIFLEFSVPENFTTFSFSPSAGISHRMEILFTDQLC